MTVSMLKMVVASVAYVNREARLAGLRMIQSNGGTHRRWGNV